MAVTTIPAAVRSPFLNTSSDSSDPVWDDLPEPEPVIDLPPAPTEKPDSTPEPAAAIPGVCATCGEVIIREPGARGRMPKYHPDCRPLKTASGSGTTTRRGSGAKEAEADKCVIAFQQLVTKAAVMLSVVDRFDAFALMVALPNICDNLRGVLIRYDSLRKDMLAMQTGGSVFGLVLALAMLFLPIAAHHGLLGRGSAAKLLVEMPFTLLKIHQRLKEGSEALTEMMREQLQKAAEENRKAQAQKAQAPSGVA